MSLSNFTAPASKRCVGLKQWTHPELVEQTASLQLCSILVGDAEVPAGKNLVAKALKAILILDQVSFEPCGRP